MSAGKAIRKSAEARGLARHRRGHGRRLGLLLCRRAQHAGEDLPRRGLARGLRLHRPADRHDLHAGRLGARAGLHLHVPVAALPGRDARRAERHRHLPEMARRAARQAQGRRELGRPRRLRRLQPLRRRMPDRHRHPRRPADRMHRLRSLHRRLQPDHGQGRPAAQPDPLGHACEPAGQGKGRGRRRLAAGAAADPALRGAACRRRRRDAGRLLAAHRHRTHGPARPQSELRAPVERRHPQLLRREDPEQEP